MLESRIPLRPKDFISPLSQQEQSALTWLVLSGCSKRDAFFTFVRPDMYSSKAKASVDSTVKQFFAREECLSYIDAYEKTLKEFLHPEPDAPKQPESMESKMARAKAKLVEFAVAMAENIERADDPESVMKIADKVGFFDTEEEAVEEPRRYLPMDCDSCEYRAFCEQECEDLCEYCRAKKFAVDNGFEYKKQTLLDFGTKVAEEK